MFVFHDDRRWLARGAIVALLLAVAIANPPLMAAPPDEAEDGEGDVAAPPTAAELQDQIHQLQAMLEQLNGESAAKIEDLLRRIRQLETELKKAQGQTPEEAAPDDELEALREAARAEVPEKSQEEEKAEKQRDSMTGHERTQQKLNPEISFLGDVSYDWSDSDVQNRFVLRSVELGFAAPLDPYTRFKGFIVGEQALPELQLPGAAEVELEIAVEVEEAYMDWVALPGGTSIRVGKFRQQFGTLNRWHPHALESVDSPFALRNLFGLEGLIGLGVGASWALPGFWATSHSLVVQITNPDNQVAFAGATFNDPAFLLRYTGFYDFGHDSYFEVGFNGTVGPNDSASDGKTKIGSIDFNYRWEPAARSRYRGFEFRGEYFFADFEDAFTTPGMLRTWRSNSYYAYLIWRLGRRWQAGLRFDDSELPSPRSETTAAMFHEGLREKAITPFITFWQSEFVRLRLQYQHAERNFTGPQGMDNDERVWLQITWEIGRAHV